MIWDITLAFLVHLSLCLYGFLNSWAKSKLSQPTNQRPGLERFFRLERNACTWKPDVVLFETKQNNHSLSVGVFFFFFLLTDERGSIFKGL